jgi:hypothetical protein
LATAAVSALLGSIHKFTQNGKAVPDNLSDARYQVALANRILANEGVLDAFGHVSLRHPNDPGRYLLARSRSPGLSSRRMFWNSRLIPSRSRRRGSRCTRSASFMAASTKRGPTSRRCATITRPR